MNMPARIYVSEAQLMVPSTDPATAQAALEAAVSTMTAALAGAQSPVTLQVETSEGQIVLAEQ